MLIDLLQDKDRVEKAILAIGKSGLSLNKALIQGLQEALIKKGFDDAIVYAEQAYLATDVNAELVRVMTICRRYDLLPEETAQVFNQLIREPSV